MRLLPVIIINWSLSYLTYARANVCGITMELKPFKSALQFPLFIQILGDLKGFHYVLFLLLRPNAISSHLKVTLDARGSYLANNIIISFGQPHMRSARDQNQLGSVILKYTHQCIVFITNGFLKNNPFNHQLFSLI